MIKWILIFTFAFVTSFASQPDCGLAKFNAYQLEYCFYKGKGPLLVFLGSQGNDMGIWPADFLKKLNQSASLLIYNRIGYGKSKKFQADQLSPITAKTTSEELHSLIQTLKGDKKIILVAHSIGGIYALYYIRHYSQEVAGLVMIDADSSFEPKENSPFQSSVTESPGSIGAREAGGFNESLDQVNSEPLFPNIPLLVISSTDHGSNEETEKAWQELQKGLVELSPQGRQIIAQGKGHFIFEEDPDMVIDAIEQFIYPFTQASKSRKHRRLD